MSRRELIRLLGAAAATWPLESSAQQSDRVRRIGVLMAATMDTIRNIRPASRRSIRAYRNSAGTTAATWPSTHAGPRLRAIFAKTLPDWPRSPAAVLARADAVVE